MTLAHDVREIRSKLISGICGQREVWVDTLEQVALVLDEHEAHAEQVAQKLRQPQTFKYKITRVGTEEGLGALERWMNQLGSEGWVVFHVHDCVISGNPDFLVFARREVTDAKDDSKSS